MQPRSSPPSYIVLCFQLTDSSIFMFSFPDSVLYLSISITVGVLVGLGLVAGLLVYFCRSKTGIGNNPLPQGLYIVNSFHVKLAQTTR